MISFLLKTAFILFVLFAIFALGKTISTELDRTPSVPAAGNHGVGKFEDGNVTCYTYYTEAISCVVNPFPIK